MAHQQQDEANLLISVLLVSLPYFSYQIMLQSRIGRMAVAEKEKVRQKLFNKLFSVKNEKKSALVAKEELLNIAKL
jgi:hypothetical protein